MFKDDQCKKSRQSRIRQGRRLQTSRSSPLPPVCVSASFPRHVVTIGLGEQSCAWSMWEKNPLAWKVLFAGWLRCKLHNCLETTWWTQVLCWPKLIDTQSSKKIDHVFKRSLGGNLRRKNGLKDLHLPGPRLRSGDVQRGQSPRESPTINECLAIKC